MVPSQRKVVFVELLELPFRVVLLYHYCTTVWFFRLIIEVIDVVLLAVVVGLLPGGGPRGWLGGQGVLCV